MELRSKKRMIRRRSLRAVVVFAGAGFCGAGAEAAVFGKLSSLVCSTLAGGNASVFSISKETTCCGLLSSTTEKSLCFRSRTRFPFLSRTVTFTSTRSVSARNVYPVDCCEGRGGQSKATERRRAKYCLDFVMEREKFQVVRLKARVVPQRHRRSFACGSG